MLHPIDLLVIVAWLALTVVAGAWYAHRKEHTLESFFVTDRNLPWWVVGTSMVATTFAADTPLVVSGWVASKGIAENWVWWTMGLAGPVSVFLFAPLWRRSGLVTDAELMELRYPGAPGRGLRALKAVWFGLLTNLLVIAWVMRAMAKIVTVVLGLGPDDVFLGFQAETLVVLALFALTAAYTTHGGLLGVVVTDLMQFAVAIGAAVGLGVLAWNTAGGLEGLQTGFATHGLDWTATTALIPAWPSTADDAGARWLVMLGLLWWGQTNVDGGGYLAQRLFAAKDERHALGAYLWFVVAHLCLRPWPWIVVGLAGMATLGPVDDPETYYPRMMASLLGPGWFGLMLASFLAAFMSTVDTQLNWGASLAVNDLYRRFIAPNREAAHYVAASRLTVIALALAGALVSFAIDEIGGAWKLALSVTAGLGAVYIARWYWWRVTAWCEIGAMLFAGASTGLFMHLAARHPSANEAGYAWLAEVPAAWLAYPFAPALTTLLSLPLWVGVAYATSGGNTEHLRSFYLRVRPGGPGWTAVAGDLPGFADDGPRASDFVGILGSVAAIYGALLGVGGALLGQGGFAWGGLGAVLVGVPAALWAVNARTRRVTLGG